MAKKGSASATIGLDYSGFQTGANAVIKIAGQMATMIRDTLSVAAGTLLAGAFSKGAGAISSFFRSMKDNLAGIFTAGEEMANLATATGMATGAYMKFQLATEKGINMEEAGRLLGKNADIMQKDAGIFRDVSLKLYAVGERIQGFWLGVADKIAPVINPLLDRLVALDLSEWGKKFAQPIADAVAIITQLALDGTLWKTMGELAAAAFQYAGEVLGKVIGIYSTEGFTQGLSSLWEGIKSAAAYLYDVLKNAVGSAFAYIGLGIVKYGNYLWELIDGIAAFSSIMSDEDAKGRKEVRDSNFVNLKDGVDTQFNVPEIQTKSGGIIDEIKKALETTKFGTPELMERISTALEKFQTKTAPGADKNSNLSAIQNFGVSSLAAVGGGGGVGFVSLTEHAATQTRTQGEIRDDVRRLVELSQRSQSTGYAPANEQHIKLSIK